MTMSFLPLYPPLDGVSDITASITVNLNVHFSTKKIRRATGREHLFKNTDEEKVREIKASAGV